MKRDDSPLDARRLGTNLARARVERGLSQVALAVRSGLTQQQISSIESGGRFPSVAQVLRIALALDLSIHRLFTGVDRNGTNVEDLAIELRHLGIVDLWVGDAVVPGSFRGPEEVINLAIAGESPDPRIIEAIPAVLSWSDLDRHLLLAYSTHLGTTRRLAWLADVALSLDRQSGFPGGCRRRPLEQFLNDPGLSREIQEWDGLGKPSDADPQSPLWRRWKIRYDAKIHQFQDRAQILHSLRDPGQNPTHARSRLIVTVGEAATPIPPGGVAGPARDGREQATNLEEAT